MFLYVKASFFIMHIVNFYLHTQRLLLLKTCRFTPLKRAFVSRKSVLLQPERCPFAVRKAVFCVLVGASVLGVLWLNACNILYANKICVDALFRA